MARIASPTPPSAWGTSGPGSHVEGEQEVRLDADV